MKAGRKDHSSNVFVAETRLLPAIDDWLGQLTDPERIDETVEVIVVADSDRVLEPPQVRRACRTIADARGRLEHLMAGLEAGLDPKLTVGRIQREQADAAAAEAVIAPHDQAHLGSVDRGGRQDVPGRAGRATRAPRRGRAG